MSTVCLTTYPIVPGMTIGWLTAVRPTTTGESKWQVRCICGATEVRSARALCNPQNRKDCCEGCRRVAYDRGRAEFEATGQKVYTDEFLTEELRAERAKLAPATTPATILTLVPERKPAIMQMTDFGEIVPAPSKLTTEFTLPLLSPLRNKPRSQLSRRERLWLDAAGRCHWCNRETKLCLSPIPLQATIDHVIPRCRGGSDRDDNVVNCCHECNERRNHDDHKLNGPPTHPGGKKSNQEPSPAMLRDVIEKLTGQRDTALAQVIKLRSLLGSRANELRAVEAELANLRALTLRDWLWLTVRHKLKTWLKL